MTQNKTERSLKTSAENDSNLRGVIGDEDPEDVDVFGFEVIYTTGDFVVPREDLLAKLEDVGLPEWMAPGVVKPHRAFGRMIDDIAEDGEEVEFGGNRIRFDINSGESRYSQHFHAKVFITSEEDDTTEGTWVNYDLGVISYDEGSLHFVDRIDEDSSLLPLWEDGIKNRARERFDRHQELHNGKDVNNMVYYLCRQWTEAVKLRDSCYFVPAAYDGIEQYIDGFRALYQWINENYKTEGQSTELFAIEIVDSERQREMVETKVRDELETEVDDLFDNVVEEVREGAAPDVIAEEVVEGLDEVDGLAERHSAVLKTELSVKRAMRDVMDDMSEDREEVIDEVLAKAGLAGRVEA